LTVTSRSVALATLIVFSALSPAAAQNRGEIRGRVVEAASQTPIGIATVTVTVPGAAAAAAPAGSAPTGADGAFRVEGLRPGRYRVRIRAMGYTPLVLPAVQVLVSSLRTDLGTVTLTASPVELLPLEATVDQADVQLAPDRNTFVVRDLPSTRGGTALDVLRNVPAVDVDIDNVVSLRGNSGVVVQINGRASLLKPAQLGNFLAQLPSDMVDKVEVVPNPSARENPEGDAGIINIVLKRRVDAGTSGGLTLGGGTTGRAEIGGNLGYQGGPLSLYGSYGFLRDNRPRTETIYRENTYLTPLTYLEETGNRSQVPLAHTLTGSAGYKLGPHDELSADVVYSTRAEAEANGILYRDLDAAHAVTGLSDRWTRGTNDEFTFIATLGHKHVFSGDGHKLTTELRFNRQREGGPTSIAARTLAPDGTPVDTSALESQTSWEHPDEYSLKVDYSRPLSSRVRLQTGYQGSLQHFHTTLGTQVFDTAQALYLPDSSRISDFTYDQLVHAAYGMLDAQLGKFQLEGGVRVERATTKFHLTTLNATYNNPYNSVFPSALVAYNFDDAHQVKLSYSTRIRRPDDTDLLDPTRRYQDPLNISLGNPYLKPEYIRALELGLQRTAGRMTIQVTPFWRHTIDAVRTIRTIDSAGVATRTFANVATSDAYGTDATVALGGGRLSGFVSTSAYRQVSNASNLAQDISVRTFGWSVRTNVSLRFSSTLDIQALLSYQAPMNVEQGRNASRTRFSFAARKKLMGDRMSVTLRVIDPFNSSRERSTTIDPRFYQTSDRRRAIRGLVLSVNWMFGRPQRRGRDDLIGPDTGAQ
jgi:outer membrane cobalamin receptor